MSETRRYTKTAVLLHWLMAMIIIGLWLSGLIIDDLPCMDNDEYRRGILTVHAKYGQDVAIQMAIKLMMSALHKIYGVVGLLPDKISIIKQMRLH